MRYSNTTSGQWYNRLHSKEIFLISDCSITYGSVLLMVQYYLWYYLLYYLWCSITYGVVLLMVQYYLWCMVLRNYQSLTGLQRIHFLIFFQLLHIVTMTREIRSPMKSPRRTKARLLFLNGLPLYRDDNVSCHILKWALKSLRL